MICFTVDIVGGGVQAIEQEYGCQLCIGPCTTRGEVRAGCVVLALCSACVKVDFR